MPNIPLELALVIRLRAKKKWPSSYLRPLAKVCFLFENFLGTESSSAADRDSLGRYWGSQAGDDVGAE